MESQATSPANAVMVALEEVEVEVDSEVVALVVVAAAAANSAVAEEEDREAAAVVVEEDHATIVASLVISRRIVLIPMARPATGVTRLAILPVIALRGILEIPGAAITVAREVTSLGIAPMLPLTMIRGPENASTVAPWITGPEIALTKGAAEVGMVVAAAAVVVVAAAPRCATLATRLVTSRGTAPREVKELTATRNAEIKGSLKC